MFYGGQHGDGTRNATPFDAERYISRDSNSMSEQICPDTSQKVMITIVHLLRSLDKIHYTGAFYRGIITSFQTIFHLHSQGLFCVWAQSVRDGVTMQCRLSLAGSIYKMILELQDLLWYGAPAVQCANLMWLYIYYIIYHIIWGAGSVHLQLKRTHGMAFRIYCRFNCMPCNEYISISKMWEGMAIIGMLVHTFVRANVQIIYFERDITFHFSDATAEENMSNAINCYGDHVEGVRFRIYLARKTHPVADIWRSNEVGWWKWNSCGDTVNIRQWEMFCFFIAVAIIE